MQDLSLSRLLKVLTDSHNHVRLTVELNPPDVPPNPQRSATHTIDTPFGPVHTSTPARPVDAQERTATESVLTAAGVSAKQATLIAHSRSLDYVRQVVAWVATHRPNAKNPGGYIRTICANSSTPWTTNAKEPKK